MSVYAYVCGVFVNVCFGVYVFFQVQRYNALLDCDNCTKTGAIQMVV